MDFLKPQLFDALVLIVTVIGLILAAIRIYGDFRRGPKWPEAQHTPEQEKKEGQL